MYTNLVNVQIIISLLKQHNVKKLVLSPGNRDVPLVHSVETDPDFECFSVVDERSAAYLALGMAEATGEAVGFVCTSSTASCNYLPAIEEASKRHIPIIALTADRENYLLYQFEDQKINQTKMYLPYTKYAADLPVVRNELDKWLCIRTVNEALINVYRGVPGPVQINFQVNITTQFMVRNLPVYRKIELVSESNFAEKVDLYANKLKGKKILVVVGENYYSKTLSDELYAFQNNYNAVILSDHFSNLEADFLRVSLCLETMTSDDFVNYRPDMVITLGGHMWSNIKYILRNSTASFEHWRVSDDGIVKDGFNRLTNIFDFSAESFLHLLNQCDSSESNSYLAVWKDKVDSIKLPDLKFSNFAVIQKAVSLIPAGSTVHCSILNAARLNAFSKYSNDGIKTYCNFGCDGIDGCMSTFLGETAKNEGLSVLIIGDLSYLYDMNVALENLASDKRILIVNNHAGGEFHTAFGLGRFPTLNMHIAASHESDIKDTVNESKFNYLSAKTEEELDAGLRSFFGESDKPIIFEVFTDADNDGKVLNAFYAMNRKYSSSSQIKMKIKKIIKKILRV